MFDCVTGDAADLSTEDTVMRRLMAHLLAEDLRPGDRLPPERELCEVLACPRAALREAIGQLSFIGVLSSRQGAGTYFRGVSASQLPDITAWISQFGDTDAVHVIDARWSYEVMAVALAAERHGSRHLRELGACVAEMREATDQQQFTEADTQFHQLLVEATDNPVLVTLGRSIHAVTHLWIGQTVSQLDDPTMPFPEHLALFEAVASRDPRASELAMHRHMVRAVTRLRPALPDELYAAVAARGREHLRRAGLSELGAELSDSTTSNRGEEQ